MATMLERNKNLNKAKKTLEDYKEDALYREVWEDVNNEKTYNFIKKYYKYILFLIVILMISVLSIKLFFISQNNKKVNLIKNYEIALQKMNQEELENLFMLKENAMSDLAMIYSYFLTNDYEKLNKIINHAKTRDFKDFAVILAISVKGDSLTMKDFEKLVSKINTKKSPFYYTGRLLLAQKYLVNDKKNEANLLLEEIIKDKDTPPVISGYAETLK